jgi:hypothetical protein
MHRIFEEDGLMSNDLEQDLELGLEEGIDLEGIHVDSHELELIDDFGDIEDLDELEEIDEFSEQRDIEEVFNETVKKQTSSSPSRGSYNEDYKRFSLLQSAIANYYNDTKYESRFIENIYVADGVGVSSELRRYLEEELFVNVYLRQIDINIELCELAKMELKA